jgi:hypothetical protein
VVDFSGGTLSTDGGALLLREANHRLGLTRELAGCFDDAEVLRAEFGDTYPADQFVDLDAYRIVLTTRS